VDSVEAGGIVFGATIGDAPQIGGQRQYGDTINVADITNGSHIAIGKNNQITVTQGVSPEEIAKAFSTLLQAVQAKPESPEKAMAQTAVQGLEAEAQKGEKAEESNVQKWISFLGEMAPDIWEVAVDTFTNPIKGVSTVFKKVAERAKAEKGK
jgi:phage tail sheath gpL-like